MNQSAKLGLIMALVATFAACASLGGKSSSLILIDGERGLENFDRLGEAAWTAADGAVQSSGGGKDPSYLVSKASFKDLSLRVEFWASDDANSGVFIRCEDPAKTTDETCYEANIYDQRPDPAYGTGAIVKVAPVAQPMPKAGGKWNVYEITAKGDHIKLNLNGRKTVDIKDSRHKDGRIALQWARGTLKFRKVVVRPL